MDGAYFIGSRVVVSGTFVGDVPLTCVPGSGCYTCEYYPKRPFTLYFAYLEDFVVHEERCTARFIVDRKRLHSPPGLAN